MISAFIVSLILLLAHGEGSMKAPLDDTADPCDDPEFADSPVCQAEAENEGCTGPQCWSCDDPLTSTECVKSSWTGWKGDEQKFQDKCSGNLVRWGQDSGVQDCGIACFGCSWIRACCNDCTSILKVSSQWKRISCTDVETQVKYSYGVQTTDSSSWSRTEKWSTSVSVTAAAHGVVEGIAGDISLTASSSHSLEETTSESWSVTTTESTEITFTQPAETCSWHWRTTITDSCGERTADSKDFILTKGNSRGNSPCCLPGLIMSEDGECPPDNAGNVINLCKSSASLSERLTKALVA